MKGFYARIMRLGKSAHRSVLLQLNRNTTDFSDAIDQLTRALDGKTIIFHSPTQLGQEIQEMLGQLNLQ